MIFPLGASSGAIPETFLLPDQDIVGLFWQVRGEAAALRSTSVVVNLQVGACAFPVALIVPVSL